MKTLGEKRRRENTHAHTCIYIMGGEKRQFEWRSRPSSSNASKPTRTEKKTRYSNEKAIYSGNTHKSKKEIVGQHSLPLSANIPEILHIRMFVHHDN